MGKKQKKSKIIIFLFTLIILLIILIFLNQNLNFINFGQNLGKKEIEIEISPEKIQSFNFLSQKLIEIDQTKGKYFCFKTNQFIDGTKVSEIINYTTLTFQTNIKFTGPDVTFNHNPDQPNQYVCYNSIDSKEGISCWNNILNPIIPNPDCNSLLISNSVKESP